MKPYVCVVGAVNLDICGRPEKKLIFRDSNPGAVTLTPGGVGRNIAHDLRLLGVEVKFLTAFGGDSHAQLLRNDCVELGMDLSCALDVPGGRTSTYLYITDERGEMQLGLCDTDISAAITPAYLQRHLDVLNSAAAVVLDGNLTAETITWLGTHCSAPLFADPVSVTKAERMRAALGALHTFKPNLTEGQNLTGESTPEGIVAALLAQGVQRVFLSMGADGILAGTRAELVHLPCLPTCMVNTTGGGDAVMAALVWAYLQGLDLRESAAAALRAGKATVEYPGTNNPDLGCARPRLRQVKNGKNSRLPVLEACCFLISGWRCGKRPPPRTMPRRTTRPPRPACRACCQAPAAWPPAPPHTARTAP